MIDLDLLEEVIPYENSHNIGITTFDAYKRYCHAAGAELFSKRYGETFGAAVAGLLILEVRGRINSQGKNQSLGGIRENRLVWYRKISKDGSKILAERQSLDGIISFA